MDYYTKKYHHYRKNLHPKRRKNSVSEKKIPLPEISLWWRGVGICTLSPKVLDPYLYSLCLSLLLLAGRRGVWGEILKILVLKSVELWFLWTLFRNGWLFLTGFDGEIGQKLLALFGNQRGELWRGPGRETSLPQVGLVC